MDQRLRFGILRVTLAGTFLLSLAGLYQFSLPFHQSGLLYSSTKWAVIVGLGALGVLLELLLLGSTWTSLRERLFAAFDALLSRLRRLGRYNWALFALTVGLYCALVLGPYGRYLQNPYVRFALFWGVMLAGSLFLRSAGYQRSWLELLGAAMLLGGMIYLAASFFTGVTNYPFTLSWSEASRYYYASLFFSRQIYGEAVPPTVLHPSRYLLQSLPFLIPNSQIWMHRLWQVILWIAITLATAYLFARRLAIADGLRRWMVVAWAFLFMLVGPVYYHLQVPLLIVLAGFDRRKFWRSLAAVLLASSWAGISRINWFPVPAMLAITLYLMEEPLGGKPLWRYLAAPFAWAVLGVGAAFGAQWLYALWSNNPGEQFTSSLTSDLLWYRLLPNPTYKPGILLASLLVSLPLLLIIYTRVAGRAKAFHPIRLLGLAAMLLVLYAGGLVVSTKIGGGSNLHNLDAYLALLMVVAAALFFAHFEPDRAVEANPPRWAASQAVQLLILVACLALPVYYAIPSGGPTRRPGATDTAKALSTIKKFVEGEARDGGNVLFIGERQLLTFHQVQGVRLISDYERVFLMEMAMAGNDAYLGRLRDDLVNHRYDLIVSEPFFITYKGSSESFGEENDAWVEQVARLVRCYYEPKRLLRDVRVQILAPREKPGECP